MNRLNKIVASKHREVAEKKQRVPVRDLEASVYFEAPTCSLRDCLRSGNKHVIAEFKRQAPASGVLHPNASVTRVVRGYAAAGAAGVSILTDSPFFGAQPDDLQQAAAIKSVPLLRKDFIVDPYQVLEARAMGADVILLIASVLTAGEVRSLSQLARSVGLEVLLEIHRQDELEKCVDTIDLIGVNNRNLETFDIDLDHSIQLLSALPDGFPAISESGIHTVNDGVKMLQAGYQALLIGTQFMRTPAPEKSFESFATALRDALSFSDTKSGRL